MGMCVLILFQNHQIPSSERRPNNGRSGSFLRCAPSIHRSFLSPYCHALLHCPLSRISTPMKASPPLECPADSRPWWSPRGWSGKSEAEASRPVTFRESWWQRRRGRRGSWISFTVLTYRTAKWAVLLRKRETFLLFPLGLFSGGSSSPDDSSVPEAVHRRRWRTDGARNGWYGVLLEVSPKEEEGERKDRGGGGE